MRTPRSSQIRADHPHPHPTPHPTAVRLARATIEIAAGNHGCVFFADILAAGFTSAEFVEHAPAAQHILAFRH